MKKDRRELGGRRSFQMNGRIWSGFRSSESQRVKGDFVPGKAANDPHIDQAVISDLIRTWLLRSSQSARPFAAEARRTGPPTPDGLFITV